jgi:hypothetical protein
MVAVVLKMNSSTFPAESQPTFRRKMSLSKSSACHVLSHWFLIGIIFDPAKMTAIFSSETSVDFQRTT